MYLSNPCIIQRNLQFPIGSLFNLLDWRMKEKWVSQNKKIRERKLFLFHFQNSIDLHIREIQIRIYFHWKYSYSSLQWQETQRFKTHKYMTIDLTCFLHKKLYFFVQYKKHAKKWKNYNNEDFSNQLEPTLDKERRKEYVVKKRIPYPIWWCHVSTSFSIHF